MKATDIMTSEVVAVSPDAPIADVATMMIDHRISAVPVVDQGELVGIVTENDLIRRVELGTERARPRWLHFLTSEETLLAEYVKAHGQTARDVMTPNVITVRPDAPVAEIADIMEFVTSSVCRSLTVNEWWELLAVRIWFRRWQPIPAPAPAWRS